MVGITLAIISGLLPSFVWLLFFLKEDVRHPEPKKLIAYAFLYGMAVTILVIAPQLVLNKWAFSMGFSSYSFITLIFLGSVEEIFKFGIIYLAFSKRRELDEPIDAMIYMIVGALGFAAVENVALIMPGGEITANLATVETVILRFIGATLLHALCSGFVGYYWALAMIKGSYLKLITSGLILASLLHAIFNYLIIKFGPITLTTIFLVFIAFFIFQDFEKLKIIEEKIENNG